MKETEESHAYAVLAKRFGCSPTYIKALLETHFEAPSDAGWEHMKQESVAREREDPAYETWSAKELSRFLVTLPPPVRFISMDWVKEDKHGKTYVATEEQLQQELRLQERSSIDPDGNLVQDGRIVKYGWLQSFSKKE